VREIDGAETAFGPLNGVADQAAADGKRKRKKRAAIHDYGAGVMAEAGGGEAAELESPVLFFGAGEVRGVSEGGDDGGVPFPGELGQELVANAIAVEAGVGVGGVGAPGDASFAKVLFYVGPVRIQEGADNAGRGNGMDGSESGGSGTSEKAEENGFGLVGPGMGERDAVGPIGGEDFVEEGQPGIAGGLLEIPTGREMDFADVRG
jgi:hypothetical protein